MFSLQFSDVLLYGTKSPTNQTFKILGHVPVRSMLTENSEHNAFIIFGGQRAITVSAGTTAEKTLWLAELAKAVADIKGKPHTHLSMGSLRNCSKSHQASLVGISHMTYTCGFSFRFVGRRPRNVWRRWWWCRSGRRRFDTGQDATVAQQHIVARVLASWRHGEPTRSFGHRRESAVRLFAAQVQEQFGLAKTVGRLHVVLPVLLQELPG